MEQAQAGAEAVWRDKLARLQHLLDKRKKEHEDKYKDTPLLVPTKYTIQAQSQAETEPVYLVYTEPVS